MIQITPNLLLSLANDHSDEEARLVYIKYTHLLQKHYPAVPKIFYTKKSNYFYFTLNEKLIIDDGQYHYNF